MSGGACILVAEDNERNLKLVKYILEYRGHEVLEAMSVEQARVVLGYARPDLIALDVQIPGGGGLALLKEIKANPALAKIPVLAVTALARKGDRERLLAEGFDGYVAKPIDTKEFGPLVESYIGKKTQP